MRKFVSIKSKFIGRVGALIGIVFAVMLAVLFVLNYQSNSTQLKKTQANIEASIKSRGNVLVSNNSTALRRMVQDLAITDITELVAATVAGDEDIVRGIYMTGPENDMPGPRVPLAYATAKQPTGAVSGANELKDSITLWVVENAKVGEGGIISAVNRIFKSNELDKDNDLIEFAAPVYDADEDKILGYVRYTFTTAPMNRAIKAAEEGAKKSLTTQLSFLGALMVVSIIVIIVMLTQLTDKITRPIASLMKSAKVIADGNYNIEVHSESNDEIGDLASDFNEMRKTIKKYTEHLQDIIDEKMRQVKDILNNIDQGLLTVDFEGKVGEEYSLRANDILSVEDVASHDIYELLKLDSKAKKSFDVWIDLIQKKQEKQRWQKLEKLAPVHSMEFEIAHDGDDDADSKFITVSYQKVFDKDGRFTKLMLLTKDETEKRKKEEMMEQERLRHENEMKTILGIANTPENEMSDFIEDSDKRIKTIKGELIAHLEGVKQQREEHPSPEFEYHVSNEQIEALYRDIHTLKGNGGSYGFDLLSQYAHKAEDALEELRSPLNSRRSDSIEEMLNYVLLMEENFIEIQEKMKLIYGSDETVFCRIPMERVEYVQKVAVAVEEMFKDNTVVHDLVKATEVLSWEALKTVGRKYQKIAQKAASTVNKEIEFVINDGNKLVPADIFEGVDEALLHIVRNAVAHGIESDEDRAELEKGIGIVTLDVDYNEERKLVSVSDNGRGINKEVILSKAVEKGIISEAEGSNLSDEDVYAFLFHSGFSTADSLTEVAGRGVGLDVVKENIEKLGGTIDIKSEVGVGTTMAITLPL